MRSRAIGAAGIGHTHQQLIRADDGEVARHRAEAVVVRTSARGHQNTVVGARSAVATGTSNRRSDIACCGAGGFPVDEAADAEAEARVCLGHKLGIIVGTHSERGRGDCPATIYPTQRIVARLSARQSDRTLQNGACCVYVGRVVNRHTESIYRVAAFNAHQASIARLPRGQGGCAVVGFGHSSTTREGERFGGNVGGSRGIG